MRDKMFCKYQKNRHPKNYYYCNEPCVEYTETPGDHLPDEKVISFCCPWLPKGKENKEIEHLIKSW